MPVFIIVVAIIYALLNTYIIARGWQFLEAIGKCRWIYLAVTIVWAVAFLAGMMTKTMIGAPWTDVLWQFGSWWLVVFLYALLAVVGFDLIRLALLIFGKKLSVICMVYPQVKLLLFAAFTLVLLVIMGVGYYNGTHAKVKTVDITVHKTVSGAASLNIVAVSDMHLGTIYTHRQLQRWITQINALQPDVVFLTGDTFDDNPAPVLRKNLGVLFEKIVAPLGVYAITGNHELMGKPDVAMNYLAQHGVQPLVDTAVLVANRFYVVGRLDRAAKQRKTLDELMAPLDKALPIIVLDHQPYGWDATAQAGADISLSGHTHHGQLAPFNLVTQSMYEQDWGYLQKGATHFYTSCGVGAWGPPVRIGSRSEIVQLRVKFE